jgi:tRNA(Leu) C34 or U34 (ribose-2'-O)-methylase TrmL
MPHVFLYAPHDFRNLCAIARTLEVLGHTECYVFDPAKLIRERYGKYRTREMRDVSAGAFPQIRWTRVDEPAAFLAGFSGRVVATSADTAASPLTQFAFKGDDLLLFGSESRGLPLEVLALADETITIPSRGQTQSLNLAIALSVVVFEADRQLRFPTPQPELTRQAV